MKKKLLVLTTVLMIVALIGVIYQQAYWIDKAVSEKKRLFKLNADNLIESIAEKLREREITHFIDFVESKLDSIDKPPISEITTLYFNYSGEEHSFSYKHSLREDDFGYSFNGTDSIPLKKIIGDRTIIYNDKDRLEGADSPFRTIKSTVLSDIDRAFYSVSYKDIVSELPIKNRINKAQLTFVLEEGLINCGLKDFDYKYAILNEVDSQTEVHSDGFQKEIEKGISQHRAVLFWDNNLNPKYILSVVFPNENAHTLSSLLGVFSMSIIFTLLIVFACFFTLHQIFSQKKLSEMKNDFINNITHEFKTPIATISLAVDTLNKFHGNDNPSVNKFLQAIKDENNRMHFQVEDILNLSRLEKKQGVRLDKNLYDANEIARKAINHVKLIVENHKGKITLEEASLKSKIYVEESYLINALVNILDNSIKYSADVLEIHVKVESKEKYVCFKIQDKGVGMTKQVIKRIFHKFYRKPKGDVHDVKGHGIGLAFVKHVVEAHDGKIMVTSEPNKGSIFVVMIPISDKKD